MIVVRKDGPTTIYIEAAEVVHDREKKTAFIRPSMEGRDYLNFNDGVLEILIPTNRITLDLDTVK